MAWYVLRTEPRAEYVASNALNNDGYEVYLPKVKTPTPRIGHSDIPLFPGYIFLRWDIESNGWPMFRGDQKIAGWIRFDGSISPIPDSVMSDLIERITSMNDGHGLWRQYHPGEKVRVVSGNTESIAEVIQSAKSPNHMAEVLIHFMGRMVRATVPWQNLQSTGDVTQRRSPDREHHSRRRTRGKGRWIKGVKSDPAEIGAA